MSALRSFGFGALGAVVVFSLMAGARYHPPEATPVRSAQAASPALTTRPATSAVPAVTQIQAPAEPTYFCGKGFYVSCYKVVRPFRFENGGGGVEPNHRDYGTCLKYYENVEATGMRDEFIDNFCWARGIQFKMELDNSR